MRLGRRRLAGDERGVTIVEFAIVSPVMCLMIMGLGELAYESYVQAVLDGAMDKAGRDSTIQSASTATIDSLVLDQVHSVASTASGTATRKSYSSFGKIAPEPFTDGNGNSIRDSGECFTDVNNNGTWDADPGKTGQGGASDATVYVMTLTFPRLFPLFSWLGWTSTRTITATTILKNQPYATQTNTSSATVCT